MSEDKLPIPRMVEVRDVMIGDWERKQLIADLSEYGLSHPYICRNHENDLTIPTPWKYMREIPSEKSNAMMEAG